MSTYFLGSSSSRLLMEFIKNYLRLPLLIFGPSDYMLFKCEKQIAEIIKQGNKTRAIFLLDHLFPKKFYLIYFTNLIDYCYVFVHKFLLIRDLYLLEFEIIFFRKISYITQIIF